MTHFITSLGYSLVLLGLYAVGIIICMLPIVIDDTLLKNYSTPVKVFFFIFYSFVLIFLGVYFSS